MPALADKLDILAGFWAIDEKPTGSKDPFALRRAALGTIRVILENSLRLNLATEFAAAGQSFGEGATGNANSLLEFAVRAMIWRTRFLLWMGRMTSG